MADRDEFRGFSAEHTKDYKDDEEIALAHGSSTSRHVFRIPIECVDGVIALLTLAKVFPGEHRLEVDPWKGTPGALLPAPQEDE